MTISAIWLRDDWRPLRPEAAQPYGMWHENAISHPPRQVELGDTALPDKDRPLDDRGKRDAPKMGKRLAKRDVKPDLILSSPAMRALTTAEIIAKKLDYKLEDIVVDDRLYASEADDLLNVIHKSATSWSA
jgi:phosphohistidine phosphatase SixA